MLPLHVVRPIRRTGGKKSNRHDVEVLAQLHQRRSDFTRCAHSFIAMGPFHWAKRLEKSRSQR